MNLKLQKKLAAKAFKVGMSRVKIDPKQAADLKEAITKADIRGLVSTGVISILPKRGISRHRARTRHIQRKKGRQRGHGRRKGPAGARTPRKRAWIHLVRAQRRALDALQQRKTIDPSTYRRLYLQIKAGTFRNVRHLLTYAREHGLLKK